MVSEWGKEVFSRGDDYWSLLYSSLLMLYLDFIFTSKFSSINLGRIMFNK